jgi:hypothetical protein
MHKNPTRLLPVPFCIRYKPRPKGGGPCVISLENSELEIRQVTLSVHIVTAFGTEIVRTCRMGGISRNTNRILVRKISREAVVLDEDFCKYVQRKRRSNA